MPEYGGPEPLRPDHVLHGFDCGAETLNSWLVRRALQNQAGGGTRTWVVTEGLQVVAYYASCTAVLLHSDVTARTRRNQPEPLPAVLLARLAIAVKHQGVGLGSALVKHFILKSLEVAQITGVRLLLVHAKDGRAASFYREHDFEPSPVDDLVLMLLVQDISG